MIRCWVQGLKGCTPVIPSAQAETVGGRAQVDAALGQLGGGAGQFGMRARLELDLAGDQLAGETVAHAGSAAAVRSSKRLTSPSVTGSRIWNSSSSPIVKSVDAAKRSRTPARIRSSLAGCSSRGGTLAAARVCTAACGRSGQIEVQRIQQLHGGARRVHGDVRRRPTASASE